MKQIIGQVAGLRYVLRIPNKINGKCKAELFVSDHNNDVVYSIDRHYDDNYGTWSDDGIKRGMLEEAREDLA